MDCVELNGTRFHWIGRIFSRDPIARVLWWVFVSGVLRVRTGLRGIGVPFGCFGRIKVYQGNPSICPKRTPMNKRQPTLPLLRKTPCPSFVTMPTLFSDQAEVSGGAQALGGYSCYMFHSESRNFGHPSLWNVTPRPSQFCDQATCFILSSRGTFPILPRDPSLAIPGLPGGLIIYQGHPSICPKRTPMNKRPPARSPEELRL